MPPCVQCLARLPKASRDRGAPNFQHSIRNATVLALGRAGRQSCNGSEEGLLPDFRILGGGLTGAGGQLAVEVHGKILVQ